MQLRAHPAEALRGVLGIPGDKSLSHRALLLGAMAVGESPITGLLEGEDVLATAAALLGLIALLRRYVTHVVALLDMDEPGRQGVSRLTQALTPCGITVAAPSYPAHDPGEFWNTPLGQRMLPPWVQVDDLARVLHECD